jgi:hypothetical protein
VMRFFVLIIGAVVALTFAGTAKATQSKTTIVHATVSAKGCGTTGTECGVGGGGSCLCFAPFWNFAGRVNLSPPFGSFTLAGLYEEGYFPTDPVDDPATYTGPFTYYRTLELVFRAPNGDKLVLESSSSSNTAPSSTLSDGGTVDGTWTVDQAKSTGRYVRFSGSGTYTLSGTVQGTYETFSLALNGSLTYG